MSLRHIPCRLRPQALLSILTLLACCTAGESSSPAYDGIYTGAFRLRAEVSPLTCPLAEDGRARMVVHGGHARIDVTQGTYFSGVVDSAGNLTLISGAGRTAFIHGHFAGPGFTGYGPSPCHYDVRMTRSR